MKNLHDTPSQMVYAWDHSDAMKPDAARSGSLIVGWSKKRNRLGRSGLVGFSVSAARVSTVRGGRPDAAGIATRAVGPGRTAQMQGAAPRVRS